MRLIISETILTTQMINTQLLHEPVLTKVISVWMPSINLLQLHITYRTTAATSDSNNKLWPQRKVLHFTKL